MRRVTSINGRIVPKGKEKISIFDNSVLYAEGLFETCLVVNDEICFLKEHLDRLFRGLKVIGIKIPYSKVQLTKWMKTLAKKLPDDVKRIRMTVSSGEAEFWAGKKGRPQILMTVVPHTMRHEPFKLWLSPFEIDQDSVFRQIKTISYAIHAASLKLARKNRCDDALIRNRNGKIAEVSSANIFWVKNKTIYTPPLSAGCLAGVTRKIVMKETERLRFKLLEKNVTLTQLAEAEEVFISSSLKLVIGVSEIHAGQKSYKIKPGLYTKALRERFFKITGLT